MTMTMVMMMRTRKRKYDVLLCDILRQALPWWAVALTFERFLGNRVVDKRCQV